MRHNTLLLAACSAALLATAACSSSSTPKPKAAATAGDPVRYLYDIDGHRTAHADVQHLVDQLRKRCSDDALGLEFTATNTATDLVDATHAHQDVYPVLAQLVTQLPQGATKVSCASRLPAAGKQLKTERTTG